MMRPKSQKMLFVGAVCAVMNACSMSSLVDVPPPDSVVDPSAITTADAAVQFYNQAVTRFDRNFAGSANQSGYSNFVVLGGVFTDELMRIEGSSLVVWNWMDERTATSASINVGTP